MDNQQTERTIYFKDLVFSVLYRWRAVLAAMLLGAVLLGGMEWLGAADRVTLNSVSVTPENQIKIDQYQSTLERTEALIEAHAVYLEESILMTLDSYAACTANLYVSVEAETEPGAYDQTAAILYAYCTELMDTAAMDALGKEYEIAPVYLRELITADVKSSGVLNVTVRGRTLEEAQVIADGLTQLMEARQETAQQQIAPHKLQISSFGSGPAVDKALYDLQNTAHQRMTTLKNTVTSTTTELNKLLPTQLQAGEPQPLLYAAVGAFLGAFLVAAIACVKHIGSGKVYSARTLKDRTGLRILGRVCGKTKNPIDRWLRKLEGRVERTQPDGLLVNIVNHCQAYKALLVVGADAEMLQGITEGLTKSGIQCTVCPEAAESPEVMQALPGCDTVLLVEGCGKSSYDDVIWTMETVSEYGKPLLGCVLIDG